MKKRKFQGWEAVAKSLRYYVREKERGKSTRPNAGQRTMLLALAKRLPEHGVLIADEVGMGKTLLAAEVIRTVVKCGGRAVVLMPTGLGAQWQDELSDVGLEAPVILRSLSGVLDNPQLNTQCVTLISHTFINWRMGADTKSWRYDLLPVMYGKWRKHLGGRLPNGYFQQEHTAELERVADSCIKACGKGKHHPIYKKMEKLTQVKWNAEEMYDWKSYTKDTSTKDTSYRVMLESCVGMALGVFDLIVIDEAHKSRGEASGLSKCLDSLLRSSQCRVMGMTATPVELDCEQWNLLKRIGAGKETKNVIDCSQKYVDAVQKLQKGWRDERTLQEFEVQAAMFQKVLAPWVLRRTKAEDEAVQLFCRLAKDTNTYAYQTENEVIVKVNELEPQWQQVVCAAEGLSMTADALSDRKTQRVRLTVANGHGLFAIQESRFSIDSDMPEAAQQGVQSVDDRRTKMRAARALWWLKVLDQGLSSPDKLYDHPAILKAVHYVEEITQKGEKVLVFGTFTRPLQVFTSLLNARALVRAYFEKKFVPMETIPDGLEHSLEIALKQLDANCTIQDVKVWLKKQYGENEYRLHEFRAHLLDKIKRDFKEIDPQIVLERERMLLDNLPESATPLLARAFEEMLPDKEIDANKPKVAQVFVDLVGQICTEDEGDANQDGYLDTDESIELWKLILKRLEEEYTSPRSNFARMISGETKHVARRTAQMAFNRLDSRLRVLVAQSQVGREGLNLHKACRHVLLLHPEWNPGVVEQQIGRVDRVGSYWSHLLQQCEKKGDQNLPHIELHCVIFKGTYDEYHWEVLKERRLALRAELHGEILPQAKPCSDSDRAILQRVIKATPTFRP